MERFAGNTDGCELFTDGIGDRVPMVAEQNERIPGRNFHIKNLQEVIVLGEMVVRLLIPGNDNASLRKSGNGKRAHRCKPGSVGFHMLSRVLFTIYGASSGCPTYRASSL